MWPIRNQEDRWQHIQPRWSYHFSLSTNRLQTKYQLPGLQENMICPLVPSMAGWRRQRTISWETGIRSSCSQGTEEQIIIAKLHPAISFLHSSNDRSTSLQLDISEIYKPLLVERTLFNLINLQKIDKTILNEHSDEPYRFDKENKYKIVKEFTTKLNTRIKKKNRYFTYKQLIFGDCISLRDYINNKTEKISFYHSRW